MLKYKHNKQMINRKIQRTHFLKPQFDQFDQFDQLDQFDQFV